jgi:hypothetical protein
MENLGSRFLSGAIQDEEQPHAYAFRFAFRVTKLL